MSTPASKLTLAVIAAALASSASSTVYDLDFDCATPDDFLQQSDEVMGTLRIGSALILELPMA